MNPSSNISVPRFIFVLALLSKCSEVNGGIRDEDLFLCNIAGVWTIVSPTRPNLCMHIDLATSENIIPTYLASKSKVEVISDVLFASLLVVDSAPDFLSLISF